MRGPKSFEAAGEMFDGTRSACNYSREALEYMVEHVKVGAERAGRDWRQLDIGAAFHLFVGPDSKLVKAAARAVMGILVPQMSTEQLERNGFTSTELQPIMEAFRAGDFPAAMELVTPETAEKLAIAGTPDGVGSRLENLVTGTGVNHLIFIPLNGLIVKAFAGKDFDIPDVKQQLRLLHDGVMPRFWKEQSKTEAEVCAAAVN